MSRKNTGGMMVYDVVQTWAALFARFFLSPTNGGGILFWCSPVIPSVHHIFFSLQAHNFLIPGQSLIIHLWGKGLTTQY